MTAPAGEASSELRQIVALVPPDFADPDADYRAVRAMMAPSTAIPCRRT